MIAPTKMKKPSNWQDFEKLCNLLWGEIWCCEDTIKEQRDRLFAEQSGKAERLFHAM